MEYLVIGGCAMQHHGAHRQTSDVDIWVAHDSQNARRLLDAIEVIIGHRPDISAHQLSQPRKQFDSTTMAST